jgi:hypothetical protein
VFVEGLLRCFPSGGIAGLALSAAATALISAASQRDRSVPYASRSRLVPFVNWPGRSGSTDIPSRPPLNGN